MKKGRKNYSPSVAVIGLGYVGLPLAVALAKHFSVIGFDKDQTRVVELCAGVDRTGEIGAKALKKSALKITAQASAMAGCDVFIIAVPTPADGHNQPDLTALRQASRLAGKALLAGKNLARKPIVVVESTVYPGVTENICGPEIESASGLKCGCDFFLGYSPERINPGDRVHTVERITKVVAGQSPMVSKKLSAIYGAITTGGIFIARDIKTAEAAKVIENAQRDINIAFINEASQIFANLGVSIHDVLAAAATKWNFLNFKPGFVGGHCIGVDPYYLAHCALETGHNPEVVLAGRRINDGMGCYVAEQIVKQLSRTRAKSILVLGLTFKENVRDLRNSKVVDLIEKLKAHGFAIQTHDCMADPLEAFELYGIKLLPSLDQAKGFDCVVGAVGHDEYLKFNARTFKRLISPGGLVADVKGLWRQVKLPKGIQRWEL